LKYQVGDTVLILHSNEEAEVIDIINTEMLLVDVQGVRFPVYMDQVDFPYFKRFTEKRKEVAKKEKLYVDDLRKEKSKPERAEDGVWFTVLPVMITDEAGHEIVDELKLYLSNHTNADYNFIYQQHFFGRPDFELKNSLRSFEEFYLHDIAFADLNDSPSFEFILQLKEPHRSKADQFNTTLKLKPKQIFAQIRTLQENNRATFAYLLFEEFPGKVEELTIEMGDKALSGGKLYDATKARQHIEQARSVLDLHIEKLTNDWAHMSNFEILTMQLKTFEKYFQLSVVHHQPSLIVIHGVGEGKLRDEIHEILRTKSEVRSFANQYHPRYGFGATEIFFQY
jgi:hypothetical protein